MSPTLLLTAWLVALRGFLALDAGDALSEAQEQIRDRSFWLLRDPGVTPKPAASEDEVGYRILIERGLEAEIPQWVATVTAVLDDERGWRAAGKRFVLVDDAEREEFSILLARPRTVDRLCRPLRTGGIYSCGRHGRAALNLMRWREGAASWGEELDGYRVYMINHEVGHLIGMPHKRCPKRGAPAPVMVQQTKSLFGCTARAWPVEAELARLRRRWAG